MTAPARPGARNLITDVAGLKVGQADDPHARTGVTVVLPDSPAVAACSVGMRATVIAAATVSCRERLRDVG